MKTWSGIAIAAAATLLSGCSDINIDSSSSGVPLSELDFKGARPTEISLVGPDRVIVTSGETLTINVEGDPDVVTLLRFELDDDELEIGREGTSRHSGIATIRVTMPTPNSVELAGSGQIEVDQLGTGDDAEFSVAGSGKSRIGTINADTLDISVAGSGYLYAAGKVRMLDISSAGSGNLDLRDVMAGDADISIAGSGDTVFSSDGKVEASITGSGNVQVIGKATCSVSAVGSGKLHCKPRATAND